MQDRLNDLGERASLCRVGRYRAGLLWQDLLSQEPAQEGRRITGEEAASVGHFAAEMACQDEKS